MTYSGVGLEMLYAGRTLTAEEARGYRLVNQVTAPGQAFAAATAAASALAGRAESADRFKKRLVWRLSSTPIPEAQTLVREG
jgi:enoyl-CoA hydratase/carnithine racemase